MLDIEKMLEDRLYDEYDIPTTGQINLFRLINYPNRPTTSSSTSSSNSRSLGYIMVPFQNPSTNRAYCPNSTDFNGQQPLLRLLGDYMLDTEGLYLAEKQPETILENGMPRTIYGTMFVRESELLRYGFYIENGVKVKGNANSMHSKTTYFYYPTNPSADPLIQGTRKLYTIRWPDTINGSVPIGVGRMSGPTSDKRIGCIPKT